MFSLALHKDLEKSSLNTLKKTFNQHTRKISQLRREIESLQERYEEALSFFHMSIRPEIKNTGDLISQFILRLIDLSQKPKALTKKERGILLEIFEHDLPLLFTLLPHADIPDSIKILHDEIFGESANDAFQDELAGIKELFKEYANFDSIDLSHINPTDSLEEMFAKVTQAFENSGGRNFEPPPISTKEKSKKELLKEQKAKDLEALQKKGMNSIYKRLAKEFHPDLEQDAEKRVQKDTLIKRLTIAYEEKDLISLLILESEWLDGQESTSGISNEKVLKSYNVLLKEQIENLKQKLEMTPFNPRYFEIHHFIEDCPKNPMKGLNLALLECRDMHSEYTSKLISLSSKDALKSLKIILANLFAFKNSFYIESDFFD